MEKKRLQIRMADLSIQISYKYTYIERQCADWLDESEKKPDIEVEVSDEAIETEYTQFAADGVTKGMCESVFIYRAIARKSMLTKIVAGLFVLFSIDARFTGLVLCVGGFGCVFSRIYSRHFKYLHKEVQRTNGVVRSYMQECLENLIVIKSFVNESAVGGKLNEFQRGNYKIRIKRNAISNFANTMVYVLFTAGYYAALVWGAL